jgi:hypothetical protein
MYMFNFKSMSKWILVVGALMIGTVALAASPIQKSELLGHVFTSANAGDNTSVKIQSNGSWIMSGTLVQRELHTSSISGANFQIQNGSNQQLLLLNEGIGGRIMRLTAQQKTDLMKEAGKSANFALVFANAEGGVVLVAE